MITLDYDYITNIMQDYYRRDKTKRTNWMNLTINGLKTTNTKFVAEYDVYEYLAKHNFQSFVMEHAVNNILTLTSDIEITDGAWLTQPYLFNQSESFVDLEYMYNYSESGSTGITMMYFYNEVEYDTDQIDFFVLVNTLDSNQEASIIYYIDLYKQGGKNYEIVYV